METIKGTIVCFCILFLAISLSGGNIGVSAGVLPLHRHATLSSSHCNCDESSLISLRLPSYENPSRDNSPARKQQLLNQVSILLKQLSSSAPSVDSVNIDRPRNYKTVNQEKVLLQNLVDRLATLKENSAVAATPSSSLPAVSQATYNSIGNQYLEIRLLAQNLLTPRDAEVVQSALDALYKTFISIVTGQLLNVELPNLCSRTLALNTQLSATDAPTELQDGVDGFIKSLTLALTGQGQVTILGLCDCLNDLETSVVTVVENDESQRLQYLLSSLVEAVTNAVVSGGDVGCNVINVVKRYAANIKQAIREDSNVRARKIYNSVLNFEEELYKVLITSDSTEITSTPSSETTTSSYCETEEEYINEITQVLEAIFGNSTNLVRRAVEILLEINRSEDQPTSSNPKQTTLESLKKVDDLLKSVSSSQTDSTDVIEALVKLLSTLPEKDVSIVLNALDPVLATPSPENSNLEPFDDATAIVGDGKIFVVKQLLMEVTDNDGKVVDIPQSGTYQLIDPNTNITWSGDFMVENGTIEPDSHGNVLIESQGFYEVNILGNDGNVTRGKRKANFEVEDNVVVQVDGNGYTTVTEGGTYNLTDSDAGTSKSGRFIVKNSIFLRNPDGAIEVIKSGILYVNDGEATSTSKPRLIEDSCQYLLWNDHIFESPDREGSLGTGTFNVKNPKTNDYQSGTYVIQQYDKTETPDGSVESTTSGLIYVNSSSPHSANSDSSLFIVDGSQFLFKDWLTYVTDIYGNISPVGTGELTTIRPQTGTINSGSYVIRSVIITKNSDGSTDITKFGTISCNNFITSSAESPTSTSGSSEYTEAATTEASTTTEAATTEASTTTEAATTEASTTTEAATTEAATTGYTEPWPISKESFDSLINSLNPAKYIQPAPGLPTTQSPSTTAQTDTDFDATSILTNGACFIIDELITPLLDSEGNVIDKLTMGTYRLMDSQTNISWSGAFEVEDSSLTKTSPSNIELTASGTFDVTPIGDNWDSYTGEFSITDQLTTIVNENNVPVASEKGTYRLTDSNTGVSKSGTFVVENTVSRPQPGGAIELIKSGLLFIDESDGTTSSPIEEPPIPGYDGYFLSDEHIYDVPDSDGNYGIGVYSVKDSSTNEYSSGTYSIRHASTTENPDGTVDRKIDGVIFVDGYDVASNPGSSAAAPSIIANGATFTIEDHLAYVTDPYGHVNLIGNERYTQVNPETGVIESENRVILNIDIIHGDDGHTRVRKFGAFPIDDDCDSSTTETSTTQSTTESCSTTQEPVDCSSTTESSTESYSTTQTPIDVWSPTHAPKMSHPLIPAVVLKTNDFEKLVKSLNPIQPVQTPEAHPGSVFTGTYSKNPIDDATAIATDGSYFIIESQVVMQRDHEGNVNGLMKVGNYSLRDPRTNVSWTGSFQVEDFSIEATDGRTVAMASGTFDVIRPTNSCINTTVTKNQAIFSIKDILSVVVDENGISSGAEDGTYSLTNPITGASTSGAFVVRNSISKVNPDSSIDIVKSGILYVDDAVPSEPSSVIKYGGYFMTDQHLLSVPDSNGNYGTGVYNIKDPATNEYTSGTYVIQETSTVNNADGTQDVTTCGLIYVDSSTSSTTSVNTDPSLAIINGTEFKFVDHLSSVTDAYGNVNVVGTGVFTQRDPQTNTLRSGEYVIQDIIVNNNPDGSQDAIQTGIFYYTTDCDASTDSSSTTSTLKNDHRDSSPSDSSSDSTLGNLKGSLEAVIGYLDLLKKQTNPAPSLHSVSGKAASATNSGSAPVSVSNPRETSNYVVLERSSVVSAINGRCLAIGDIVVIEANNGAVLVATIRDSDSPVTFFVTSLADLTRICTTTNKVWTVLENDFPKQDRSLIDAVLKPANPPCSS